MTSCNPRVVTEYQRTLRWRVKILLIEFAEQRPLALASAYGDSPRYCTAYNHMGPQALAYPTPTKGPRSSRCIRTARMIPFGALGGGRGGEHRCSRPCRSSGLQISLSRGRRLAKSDRQNPNMINKDPVSNRTWWFSNHVRHRHRWWFSNHNHGMALQVLTWR